jgi:hypothetical protein
MTASSREKKMRCALMFVCVATAMGALLIPLDDTCAGLRTHATLDFAVYAALTTWNHTCLVRAAAPSPT